MTALAVCAFCALLAGCSVSAPTTSTPPATAALPLVHAVPVAANRTTFSPDDRLLALATIDYQVLVYDTLNWEQQWNAAHAEAINGVAFSPDGRRLDALIFAGVPDSVVWILDVPT